ncbi:SDR family NAD(P)-dependent oxidoreductase [Luteipulveratus mongoliensis]|uniref:Short-chain dehydrogenase n=1 Tax=Luteipulveratus mongoliensis TaxID=571913 RepID=A0A0K1JEZ5_9MICO|nr:SDR family oxidoreductase [Luteipulveratus mongoliensis]AKU15163.1 hypothetical protein VV02_03635 [Luteipulveratus mongoliensis]
MTDFTDRRAVVVGGTKGIGRAVVDDLASSGARVAVVGRDREVLKELETAGHLALEADLLDDASVSAAFEEVAASFGGLDIAVNTAGMFPKPGPVGDLDPQVLADALLTNVVGIQRVMRQEIALMGRGLDTARLPPRLLDQRPGGAIVNFSSNIGAHRTQPNLAAYGVSKAAVSALTRAAALDHVKDGIRINAVSPGPSDTTMSIRPGETVEERDARVAQQNPSGRVARLPEIVAAVRYLISDEAAYVVGTDLVIDGGISA